MIYGSDSMFIGKYNASINKNGKVYIHERLSENYNIGDKYLVIIHEDSTDEEIALKYRFNSDVYSDEKVVAEYTVGSDKMLTIPTEYLLKFQGKCNVTGVISDIEISTRGFHEINRYSKEQIKAMLDELDFFDEDDI